MKRMNQIKPLTEQMIAALEKLVKYNSAEGEPLPGKLFGEGPAA